MEVAKAIGAISKVKTSVQCLPVRFNYASNKNNSAYIILKTNSHNGFHSHAILQYCTPS